MGSKNNNNDKIQSQLPIKDNKNSKDNSVKTNSTNNEVNVINN